MRKANCFPLASFCSKKMILQNMRLPPKLAKLLRRKQNYVSKEKHNGKTFKQIGKKYLRSQYCGFGTPSGRVFSLDVGPALPIPFWPLHCLIACCENCWSFRNVFMQVHLLFLTENPDKFGKMTGSYFHNFIFSLSLVLILKLHLNF